MAQLGVELVTPVDSKFSAGVCIIDVPPNRRREAFNRLYEQYGIAGSTTGGLRLCPHIYNTDQHIQRAAEAVKAMRDLIA